MVSSNVPPPQLWGGQHTEMFVNHVTVFSQSVTRIRLSHTILYHYQINRSSVECQKGAINIQYLSWSGVVTAQWIRLSTHKLEVPGSNPLATAVEPLGKALYPNYLVPQIGLFLKPLFPWFHSY